MRLIDADALLENNNIKGATKYGNKNVKEEMHSYSTMMMYEIADMIEDAPTVSKMETTTWIPCSEKLPEIYEDTCTSEIVLVQGYDKEIDYEWQAMGWYADETKQWYFAECKNTDKQIDWIDIIAWQPLPQPYKGETMITVENAN